MEQMMTTLSFRSRMTSNSNSFQPIIDFSMRTLEIGLMAKPNGMYLWKSSQSLRIFPPVPPSVKEGRTTTGNRISRTIFSASSMSEAYPEGGISRPIFSIDCRKSNRSSAFLMESVSTPTSWMLYFPKICFSWSSRARFNAFCPPKVGRTASGLSLSIILSKYSTVNGSR